MMLKEALEDKAKDYAEKAHKGQTRKFGGEPYISHPNNVASIIKRFKSSHKIDELVSAALLHDTIEDTDTTLEDLHKLFGGLVASIVKELTSEPKGIEEKGKAEYLANKMKSMTSWALVIKLADRLDNVSDLKTATPEFAEKYGGETRRLLKMLEKERKFTSTQQKIIDAIIEKLDELDDHKFNEEFKIGIKDGNRYFEIFINPTKKEIENLGRVIRFIIDEKKKKIYFFKSHLLHYDASKKLGIPYLEHDKPNYVYGLMLLDKTATIKVDSINNTLADKVLEKKHWSKKWFEGVFHPREKLEEEFKTRIKIINSIKDQIDIYENPSRFELNKIKRETDSSMMRFIIDDRINKIYVWDVEVWHSAVAKKLKIPFQASEYNSIQFGYGQGLFDGKKIDVAYIRSHPKLLKKIKKRGHWSNRWLVGTDEI